MNLTKRLGALFLPLVLCRPAYACGPYSSVLQRYLQSSFVLAPIAVFFTVALIFWLIGIYKNSTKLRVLGLGSMCVVFALFFYRTMSEASVCGSA